MDRVPLKVVQELLGHQTIQMTMRYSHLTPDVRRGAIELLEGEPESGTEGKAKPRLDLEPQHLREPDGEPDGEPGLRPNNGQTAGVINADEGNRP